MASKEERRIDILNASIKVFSKYGFHKAKIQEIAEEAGVGKGTIYEYFDSKKSLFQEMIKYIMDYYIKGIKEIGELDGDFKAKILSYLEYNVNTLTNHMSMFKVIMHESNEISQDMQLWMMSMRKRIYEQIAYIVEEAIAQGELREDLDKEVATLMIIGTVNQYCGKKIFSDKLNLKETDFNTVINTLINGLG